MGGKALQHAVCEYAYMSVYGSVCVQRQAVRDTGMRVYAVCVGRADKGHCGVCITV